MTNASVDLEKFSGKWMEPEQTLSSLCNRQRSAQKLNQSKCRVVEPSPNGYINSTTPAPCGSGLEKRLQPEDP